MKSTSHDFTHVSVSITKQAPLLFILVWLTESVKFSVIGQRAASPASSAFHTAQRMADMSSPPCTLGAYIHPLHYKEERTT